MMAPSRLGTFLRSFTEVRVRESGHLVLKSGVMGVVVRSGRVAPGDEIVIGLPPEPHRALERD